MFADVARALAGGGLKDADGEVVAMTTAQAYVLTQALAGAMRSVSSRPHVLDLADLEEALARLVIGFLDAPRSPARPPG